MKDQKDIFNHLKKGEIPTPDQSYFEGLAESVIESQSPKIVPLYKKPIAWISSAAAALIILFFTIPTAQEQNTLLALQEVSTEEVIQYIDERIEDFDVELIAEVVAIEQINPTDYIQEKLTPTLHDTTMVDTEESLNLDEIDPEDILEYINEEEIDIFDIDELYI